MVFKDVCIFVHWANVTSALEGLSTQLFRVLFAWLCCISKCVLEQWDKADACVVLKTIGSNQKDVCVYV